MRNNILALSIFVSLGLVSCGQSKGKVDETPATSGTGTPVDTAPKDKGSGADPSESTTPASTTPESNGPLVELPVEITTKEQKVICSNIASPTSPEVQFSADWPNAKLKENGYAEFKQISIVPYPGTDIKQYKLSSLLIERENCDDPRKTKVHVAIEAEKDGLASSFEKFSGDQSSIAVDQSKNIYNLGIIVVNEGNCEAVRVKANILYVQQSI